MSENEKCIRCISRITWISLCNSILLALFKGVVGILTHSRALTASSLYSLNDVISAIAVIIGLRVAKRPADRDYPYGYGNAEFIVGVFTSILILAVTVFLMGDCIRIIFRDEHPRPHWAALGAAMLSVFANEVIYRYNICAVRQVNSPALSAHAKHYRADTISSLAVAAAIIGSMMGYRFLDAFVAVFEAGHLIFVSTELLYQCGSGLIDRAIEDDDITSIRRILSDMPEVNEVRDIKTRQIGSRVWIDLYVSLPSEKTIDQVNEICRQIRGSINKKIEYLEKVNIICE